MASPGSALADEDGDAVADGSRVGEPERVLVVPLAEEPLAAAQNDGHDHQSQLVDELVLEQPLDEPGAAVDDDVAVDVVLELGDRIDEVAAQYGRVVSLGVLKR